MEPLATSSRWPRNQNMPLLARAFEMNSSGAAVNGDVARRPNSARRTDNAGKWNRRTGQGRNPSTLL